MFFNQFTLSLAVSIYVQEGHYAYFLLWTNKRLHWYPPESILQFVLFELAYEHVLETKRYSSVPHWLMHYTVAHINSNKTNFLYFGSTGKEQNNDMHTDRRIIFI